MVSLRNEQRSFYCFLRLHPKTTFGTLVDYDGYSISSKGFLPTVVDLMVILVKFTHSSPFSSWIPIMSSFTLAISCLTASNLPWFTDLIFQVPMQYCSLQHWTLLLSLVTSTTGCYFRFGSVSSFFIIHSVELFVHWSPEAYWAPTDLGSSSFSVLSFCLFIVFMGFSRQEYWSGLPFPPLMDHILSELYTMTHPSWITLYGMGHSFIEFEKAVFHVIRLVSFLWLWFLVCLPSDGEG